MSQTLIAAFGAVSAAGILVLRIGVYFKNEFKNILEISNKSCRDQQLKIEVFLLFSVKNAVPNLVETNF